MLRVHALPTAGGRTSASLAENRQEIDKSAVQQIGPVAKSLLELVELMGIEPMTS